MCSHFICNLCSKLNCVSSVHTHTPPTHAHPNKRTQQFQHHDTLPTFSTPHTTFSFHPTSPTLIVSLTNNKFVIYDIEDRKFSDWFREYGHMLPDRIVNSQHQTVHVAFDASRPHVMLLQSHFTMCRVDLRKVCMCICICMRVCVCLCVCMCVCASLCLRNSLKTICVFSCNVWYTPTACCRGPSLEHTYTNTDPQTKEQQTKVC